MARKRKQKSSARPTLSPDVVWAARNWYLYDFLKKKEARTAASDDRIGISQATKTFVDKLPRKCVPDVPPRVNRTAPSLDSALYPYTRDVQLANQGIGYGENNVDVVWEREGREKSLIRAERPSRRTRSGRQPEARPAQPQQVVELAANPPEADPDLGRHVRSSEVHEIKPRKTPAKPDTKPKRAARLSTPKQKAKAAKK